MRNYELDLTSGVATFLPEEGELLNLAAVEEATESAGFEALELQLQLRGELSLSGGELILTVPESEEEFPLLEGTQPSEQAAYERLTEFARQATGQRVVVRLRAERSGGRDYRYTVLEIVLPRAPGVAPETEH